SFLTPLSAGAAEPTGPFGACSWGHVRSPERGDSSVLNGVTADSPRTLWAVGNWYDADADTYHTLVARRDPGWLLQPSEDPGNSRSVLQGVGSTTDGDAWAVGFSQNL